MSTLYELTEQWAAVLSLAEEGADAEAIENALADIGGEIEDKADGYAKVIKELEGQAEVAKAEKERLYARETAFKNSARNMKLRLEEAMVRCGKPKIKTDLFSFNIQKNAPSVRIEDEGTLIATLKSSAPDLLKTKIEIDKKALLGALKEGLVIKGAEIQQSESLRIR